MRVLYLPDWVFQALQAQGYSRRDVLNEKLLLSILSGDDVAFLSVIQEKLATVIPESVLETFPNRNQGWWPSEEGGMSKAVMDRFIEYNTVGTPEPFETPYSNLQVELMHGPVEGGGGDEYHLVFSPVLPRSKVPAQNGIGASQNKAKLALLDRTIQALYSYLAYPDLAVTPLMRDFLLTTQAVVGR